MRREVVQGSAQRALVALVFIGGLAVTTSSWVLLRLDYRSPNLSVAERMLALTELLVDYLKEQPP